MKQESKGLFKIIKHSFFWLFVSGTLMIGSLLIFFLNLRFSIEFSGGIELTLEQVSSQNNLTSSLEQGLITQGFEKPQINIENNGSITDLLISLPFKDDEQVKEVSNLVNTILLEQEFITSENQIIGSSLNGPSVSSYMKSSAINAIVVGLILISIYIMFTFAGVRKHVSPLALGGVTIASMLFSVIIPMGAYGLWMALDSTVTINTIFIISILTAMGYSMNDTIIILDRIRENFINQEKLLERGELLHGQLIENSIWQTARRSIGTGVTTLIITLTMFIFGTSVLQQFAFTISMGVIAGTFSSLFFASPLTYIILNKWKKELKKL